MMKNMLFCLIMLFKVLPAWQCAQFRGKVISTLGETTSCDACRGFGTVRYSTPDDAQAATQIMNGAEVGGRTITVRIDRFA